jgi:hypothetical protein
MQIILRKFLLEPLFVISLILVSSFMIWPPAIQSVSFGLILLFLGLLNNKNGVSKNKILQFVLASFFIFLLILSNLWSDIKTVNFNLIGLYMIWIGTLFIYYLKEIEFVKIEIITKIIVLSGYIYIILWFQDTFVGLDAYYEFHKLSNPLTNMPFLVKLKYIFEEFYLKNNLNLALNDGFYYLNRKECLFRHYNYIAPYFIFVIIALFQKLKHHNKKINIFIYIFSIICFSVFVFFLGSTINTALLILVLCCLFVYFTILKHRKILIFSSLLILCLCINKKQEILNKIEKYEWIQKNPSSDVKNIVDYSRYEIYKSAYKVWKENKMFGTGINDVDKEINKKLPKVQIMSRINLGNGVVMNTHSFPLFVLCSIGFVGLVFYGFLWLMLVYRSYKNKSIYGLLILFTLFANSLFENFFNRSFGIYLFCIAVLFSQLLFNKYGRNQ